MNMKRAEYNIASLPHPVRLLVLPAALALQWAASRAPEVVERLYASVLYPRLARALAAATGVVPFSIGEGLIALAALALLGWLYRVARHVGKATGQRWRLAGAAAARAAAGGGMVYLLFLLLWGLNYHRPPLAVITGLGQATTAVALDELEGLCAELVGTANDTRKGVPEDEHGVGLLREGVRGTLGRAVSAVRAAASAYPVVHGPYARPKGVLLSTGMSYLGVSGIYLPFTAEANVNVIVPASQLPFTACHELAHQGGIAPEDEANFLAYAACLRHPDPDFRYSGALNAALYAVNALAASQRPRAVAVAKWSPAVRRDLDALTAWNLRYQGPAETAARAVNDAYLKTQGVAEGVRSYGRMVDLLILERRRAKRDGAREGGSGGSARAGVLTMRRATLRVPPPLNGVRQDEPGAPRQRKRSAARAGRWGGQNVLSPRPLR
jgi:uncharacterized protein DUF3810